MSACIYPQTFRQWVLSQHLESLLNHFDELELEFWQVYHWNYEAEQNGYEFIQELYLTEGCIDYVKDEVYRILAETYLEEDNSLYPPRG
jgi:hypothetical protein